MSTATVPTNKTTPPVGTRSAETRSRIIAAAIRCFAESGFKGASLRAIATEAGVAHAALRYHFSSKDLLWRAACDDVVHRFTKHMMARADGLRGVERRDATRLVLRELVLFAAAHSEIHQFMFRDGAAIDERRRWLVRTHISPLIEVFRTVVEPAQAAGYLRKVPVEPLFFMLVGAAATPYLVAGEYALATGREPTDAAVVEEHADAFVKLLMEEP